MYFSYPLFFLALSCRSISVPFSLKKSAKCEIASPSLRSSGSSSSTHKYGKHMAPFKRPIFEQSSRFSAFPPSPKKNSFFVLFSALLEKVQRSGTCVCPSVTSQMISLPLHPRPRLLYTAVMSYLHRCLQLRRGTLFLCPIPSSSSSVLLLCRVLFSSLLLL